jgi:hypothetical protein
MREQGLRLSEIAAKEIRSWARVYLDDHPELVADARPVVEAWIAQDRFGKRAQGALAELQGV